MKHFAAMCLFLIAACQAPKQVPKQEGWQDTPTVARKVRQPTVVVVFNFLGVTWIKNVGAELDQSGAVGGGTAKGLRADQKADQKVDTKVDAEIPIIK